MIEELEHDLMPLFLGKDHLHLRGKSFESYLVEITGDSFKKFKNEENEEGNAACGTLKFATC